MTAPRLAGLRSVSPAAARALAIKDGPRYVVVFAPPGPLRRVWVEPVATLVEPPPEPSRVARILAACKRIFSHRTY